MNLQTFIGAYHWFGSDFTIVLFILTAMIPKTFVMNACRTYLSSKSSIVKLSKSRLCILGNKFWWLMQICIYDYKKFWITFFPFSLTRFRWKNVEYIMNVLLETSNILWFIYTFWIFSQSSLTNLSFWINAYKHAFIIEVLYTPDFVVWLWGSFRVFTRFELLCR